MNTAIGLNKAMLDKDSFLTLARVRTGDNLKVVKVAHGTEGGLTVQLERDGQTIHDVTLFVCMLLGIDIENTEAGIIIPAYLNISAGRLKARLGKTLRR